MAAPPEGYQATELADSEGEGIPTPVEIVADADFQPLAQEAVDAAVAEQAVAVVPFVYVVSKTKRCKCFRLHFLKIAGWSPESITAILTFGGIACQQ